MGLWGGLGEQLARTLGPRSGLVMPGGATKKEIKRAKKRGEVLVPEQVVTFRNENPEAYQDRMYGLPNAIDIAQMQQGPDVNRRDILVQQLLGSRLGREMVPGHVTSWDKKQEMMNTPGAQVVNRDGQKALITDPNNPFSAPVPIKSIGEITDVVNPPTGMVQNSPLGPKPLSNEDIRGLAGGLIKQTRQGLEQLGLSHEDAVNALSSELQTGNPKLDPQKIFNQTQQGQVQNIINDPQFQARAKIEGEILPPLLTDIDRKKALLGELVGWENSGRRGRSPLYGYSDWLDHPYGSYDSGMLAAEITSDESNLETRAINEFLSGYTKEENINEKLLNMINSSGSPSPGYFQQQGYPFPQLASVVLAAFNGGSTSAPSSTTFASKEQKDKAYKRFLGGGFEGL